MFSRRINIDLEPNRLTTLLRKKQQSGEDIIDLTKSNPTKAGFRYNKKEIIKAISDEDSIVYEADPKGLPAARNAVTDYYYELGYKVNPSNVFIIPSTSEAYSYLFKLLADAEDEILVPCPSYPLFEYLAQLDFVNVVYYPLNYDNVKGWAPDRKALYSLLSPKTKAIVIVNPNNPTGSYIKSNDLDFLNEFCMKNNLAMIVDEVFSDFEIEKESDSLSTLVSNNEVITFILNGFSKMLGMPQLKLGWIITSGKGIFFDEAIEKLEIITDTYLSVSSPVQLGVKKLLNMRSDIQNQIKERISLNYEFIKSNFLLSPDIKILKCEGGWNAVLSFENLVIPEEEFVYKLLQNENVFVHPGYFYEFQNDGYAVISLITEIEIFKEGIKRISSFIKSNV